MRFRQLVRTVDTMNCYDMELDPGLLKAQYNPERFHFWKSLHNGPPGEELNMIYSPHYRFLRGHEEAYWQLQRYYGRGNKWIKNKIYKFISVSESMAREGFIGMMSALEKPLVSNPYNSSYEIYEGHHRVACALYHGFKKIPCEVIRRK